MVEALPLPPLEYLRACFGVNPTTGVLRWRHRPRSHFASDGAWLRWNRLHRGRAAGSVEIAGYRVVKIGKRRVHVSRVIFKMMTGDDPRVCVDHRDGDRGNNRWCNLRAASYSENQRNKRQTIGRLLPKGVSRLRRGGFRATVGLFGRKFVIGTFDTPEAAHAAYCAKALELHGEFARLS